MRVAIVLLLLVLVGASAFVTLNWGAVITPTDPVPADGVPVGQ